MKRSQLTQAQLGLWLGHQQASDPSIYNCAEQVTLSGELDVDRFERALSGTLEAASSLHLRFVEAEGEPQAIEQSLTGFRLGVSDLRQSKDAEKEVADWSRQRLRARFEISKGHAWEHRLFRLPGARYIWVHVAHHIVLDGFGFHLIAKAVAERYSGAQRVCSFGSMRSVLEADLEYEGSERVADDLAFWSSNLPKLASASPLSQYRSHYRSSESAQPAAAVRARYLLSSAELSSFKRAAGELGVSLTQLPLALVASFAHQVNGCKHLELGVPVMLRFREAALSVPCVAMNIVRFPFEVPRGVTLQGLAKQLKARSALQASHERFRYERLPGKGIVVPSFSPVVNVIPFGYEPRFLGCTTSSDNLSAGPVEELSFTFIWRSEGLVVMLDGHEKLYTKDALERLCRDFLSSSFATLARPDEPLLPDRQPGEEFVADLLKARFELSPSAVALVEGENTWTYDELRRAALVVSSSLHDAGVKSGEVIGLDAPRCASAIVAVLGIILSGCAYLALDPAHPVARSNRVLALAGPTRVVQLGKRKGRALTLPAGTRLVSIEPQSLLVRSMKVATISESELWLTQARLPALGRDIAYISFTSGSSGEPKGVSIPHGALGHFVKAAQERYGITTEDRVLQFASLAFDASVEEIFVTLYAGATLVVRDERMLSSMSRFLGECWRLQITVLDLPTAYWHELAWALEHQDLKLPARLHTTIIGGEAALPARVRGWLKAAPQCRLLNTYGPTETTVVATVAELSEVSDGEAVPIGRPLAGVGTALIDASGQVVDTPGVRAELVIFGPTVGLGYFQRDDLTSERFAALEVVGGAWAYRTGDQVSLTAEGELVYRGRCDDEVKISGVRISPAEIEATLMLHSEVKAAVVVARLGSKSVRLQAFVEGKAPGEVKGLREYLTSRLPETMIPSEWYAQQVWPRNSSGKIDRGALSSRVPVNIEPASESLTLLESAIVEAWREVLGIGVDADTNVFSVGGHSLQVIQVANRLGRAHPGVSVASLFRYPTARSLASHLTGEGDAIAASVWRELPFLSSEGFRPSRPARGSRSRVLLTGATGLVGAHILRELIDTYQCEVVCLVRGTDFGQAQRRLDRIQQTYRLQSDASQGLCRMSVICGELGAHPSELPSSEQVGEIDVVIHCAAEVSLTRDYSSLKRANVDAVTEMAEFAGRHGAAFNFISTLAVAPRDGRAVEERIFEAHAALGDGYQQSKWQAELVCEKAAALGVSVGVFRLGRITGAVHHPVVNRKDIVWRIVRASLRARVWPALNIRETWMPVDVCSAVLCELIFTEEPAAPAHQVRVFNLAQNGTVALSRVHEIIEEEAFALPVKPISVWRREVERRADAEDEATLAFFELMAETDSTALMGPIECGNVVQGVTQAACAPVSDELIRLYCRDAVRAFL